jgi:hypothetical protein
MPGGLAADNPAMAGGNSVVRWEAVQLDTDGSRGAPRRGPASEAQIVLPGRGLQYAGVVAELHADGCVIETKCALEAGTSVEVWLRTEGMPLRVAARLVQRRVGSVEFKFAPMTASKAAQIEDLRAELAFALKDPG